MNIGALIGALAGAFAVFFYRRAAAEKKYRAKEQKEKNSEPPVKIEYKAKK